MTQEISLKPADQRKRKRGFTLTEIAIVLGIIGLILGAIWVAASAVYNNLNVNAANTGVLQIVQGVRALYATSANLGTATGTDITGSLVTAHAIPNNFGTSTPLVDNWAGGTTAVWSTSTGSGDGFIIYMTKVPQAPCISLLNAVGGQNHDPGLFYLTGAGALATVASTIASPVAIPTTPAAAATSCSISTSTGNIVGFGFSLH